MTSVRVTFRNGRFFDGAQLHDGLAICFENGLLSFMGSDRDAPRGGTEIDLAGDILSHGYVDLQVNGGGGVMFNDDPSVETLARISSAHRGLGVAAFLPTLITDTAEKTRAAIAAATDAIAAKVPGIAGLHLEGPHLSIARKGAHDPALIRPMQQRDLDVLLAASQALPMLKVTLAPESVAEAQVAALAAAGVLVSLGHTDASHETCQRYISSGARCATHLFNAMSQLGSREPGLVGAAIGSGDVSAGLIADGVHVHPASMRAAWAAKAGPGGLFLVSDAMAVAGTSNSSFFLGGRRIDRGGGRLTLADGTLAGADLDLTTAIRVSVERVGVPLADAIAAATTTPARLIGMASHACAAGKTSLTDMIRISADLREVSRLA